MEIETSDLVEEPDPDQAGTSFLWTLNFAKDLGLTSAETDKTSDMQEV